MMPLLVPLGLKSSNCDYSTSFPALYATELKADFYLQLNAEPQRIKKMVPYFVGSHKKCPPGWAMIDDNHVCFCPLLQAKRTIWNIPSLPRIRFLKDRRRQRQPFFKTYLNFQKRTLMFQLFHADRKLDKKWVESLNYFRQAKKSKNVEFYSRHKIQQNKEC